MGWLDWGMNGEGRTSLLSSVRRTATPASTLPTVREINIMVCDALTWLGKR